MGPLSPSPLLLGHRAPLPLLAAFGVGEEGEEEEDPRRPPSR